MFSGLLVDNFEPFLSLWNVWCTPIKCDQGYFVPVGWQEELEKNNIAFELRDDLTIEDTIE